MIASAVPTVSKSVINEPLLEDRFAALEVARSWKPRVLSRLESLIRNGTDRDLYRINALAFGAKTGMIRKRGNRFYEKIMLKQKDRTG
jgi:hypothetical protein